ncbi:N-6 DNA methylase [Flavobacterium frigoris]|uniref:Type I restriction-modification system, DNA-methyltransferase subunit M n=1 Tax=Flavobacterium frigoris (strain PS1) TaxID=1086011 RepID=H7FSY7_FLAFP|nr:N-6 DNA methylase [Flavobacterium frigoris]EIA08684.1 type I restriction-modification system, DNA-methyltransferase subunit M [Flavobacterium frigoris PS1]
MDIELQRSYQVKKYLEKLGYPPESIYFEYSISSGKRIDVVVKKEKSVFIAIEVKNPQIFNFETIVDIEYHPLTRKIQREAQEVDAEYFILTNGTNYLWMKTGFGGRPEKIEEVKFSDFNIIKNTENEFLNIVLNHIFEFLRNFPITGNHLYDTSLVIYTKLKKETDVDFDIRRIYQSLFSQSQINQQYTRKHSSEEILNQAIERLDTINLSNNKLTVIEYIDNLFLRNSNDLSVPRWLSDFMMKILNPLPEDNIIDLFARNGTITSSVYLNNNEKVVSYYTNQNDYYWIKIQQLLFLGKEVEIIFEPLLINGRTDFLIENLANDILIVPPFNQKISNAFDSELFHNGIKDSTSIFIETALKAVRENGKIMVIVADNFLSSNQLLKVRKYFLRESIIESIISLPQDTFKPYSLVKTSLITFVKTSSRVNQNTFFAAIEESPKEYLLDSKKSKQLNEILANHNKFKLNEDFTKSKSGFVVKELDVENLHFSKYLFRDNIYHNNLSKGYLYIPIKELTLDIYRGSALVSDDEKGDIPYIGPASIRKMRIIKDSFSYTSKNIIPNKNIKIETQDILVNAIGPNRGKAAIVSTEFNGMSINRHIIGIKVNNNLVLPEYLAIILNSKIVQEQFYDQSSGSVIPSLNLKSFEQLIIPIPNFDIQEKTIQEFNYITSEYNNTLNKLAEIESKLNNAFNYLGKEEDSI